jgi:DNA-binding SARP family transcriptional activator
VPVPELSYGLLGPVEVRRNGALVPVGGTKQRIVLALLAMNAGRVVGTDQLVEAVWGDGPPQRAVATLQVYASNLRRVLAHASGQSALIYRRPGYLLDTDPAAVDSVRFADWVADGERLRVAGDAESAAARLRAALNLWRGPALADLASEPFAAGPIARLEAERHAALEQVIDIELDLGRAAALVGELEQLVRQYPLREPLWARLMLAQYRAGRPADALASFRRAREALADELGLDPGAELIGLERQILTHAPELSAGVPRARPAETGPRPTIPWEQSTESVAWLVFPRGDRVAITAQGVVIGRGAQADVELADARVSRRHAIVQALDDGCLLRDLGSTNGTEVNGVRVPAHHPRVLRDGDEVTVGGTRLTVAATGGDPGERGRRAGPGRRSVPPS